MKIKKTRSIACPCGDAPMDFMYTVEQEVLLDDNSTIYVQLQMLPMGETCYAINKETLFSEKEPGEPIEMYEEYDEALKSTYSKYFKRADKLLAKKVDETMKEVDDTKYCGGIRFGAKLNSEGLNYYVESVAHLSKEDKYLYLQLNQVNGKNHYSVTDTSIFMRMELGEIYQNYFGEEKPVTYLVDTDSLDNLGDYDYMKGDFEDISKMLQEAIDKLKSTDK